VPHRHGRLVHPAHLPWSVGALGGAVTDPAWRAKPSWYLVATEDRMIPPPAQPAPFWDYQHKRQAIARPRQSGAGRGCSRGRDRPCGRPPEPPGCCGPAGGWCFTPPPSWSPHAPPDRTNPPSANCSPPQRQAYRLATPRSGIQFHPGHGEWIKILRESGFLIDALHELYAPPDAPDHPLLHAGERGLGPPVASRGSMGHPPRRLMPEFSLLKCQVAE
jgi:hypothetical protein